MGPNNTLFVADAYYGLCEVNPGTGMNFLLRCSLLLPIWASFAVLPDIAGKTMPAFFVKWFGAVWMKYAMQELDIYFLVAIAPSLYLSV